MKPYLFLALLFSSPLYASEWCDAFIDGYLKGVCYRDAECMPPPVMCPYKESPSDDELDAYMKGLNQGLSVRKERIEL